MTREPAGAKPRPALTEQTKRERTERDERLAAALRDNLRRRKSQLTEKGEADTAAEAAGIEDADGENPAPASKKP